MKKIKIVLVILSLSLLLSGCNNFRLANSIDDLISPISPSGDNAGVQNAVDEYCKSGYLIKIPSNGDYTTSFIFYDLDGDKQEEAIAFYEPSADRGTANLAVLKKTNSKWNVVESIKGDGSDVRSVDFCDVNNDGFSEILVCWSVISKSNSYKFNVYTQVEEKNSTSLKSICKPVSAGDFICTDINEDKVNEVVVFNIGSAAQSPTAELYSFADNSKKLLGKTKLDNTIISFEHITSGMTDEGMSIYADALKSDGNSMVTEFIYWSDYYDSIVSPFYSYDTGETYETTRNSILCCRDIDDDGFIEIPIDKSIDSLPTQITAQSWSVYENTVLKHKCYTYTCKRDSYSLMINDRDFSKLKVKYDSESRILSLISKEGNEECFSIITMIKSAYNPSEINLQGYTEILSNSGFVYLAKINKKADIQFTVDNLKTMIKPY